MGWQRVTGCVQTTCTIDSAPCGDHKFKEQSASTGSLSLKDNQVSPIMPKHGQFLQRMSALDSKDKQRYQATYRDT